MTVTPLFGGGVFPLGTHVYREPYQDQQELLADLPLLKRLGFNMIKLQESWAIDEPGEGVYDFTRIERIIARAGELQLGVYLGLTMEQAPAWMWQKFPDCRLVYANGLPHNDPTQYCLPTDGKPGPCWDHPGARAAAERFIGALARRLGRFEHIWAWNTWQEIGFWRNDGGPLGFCYCPHTLTRFREWLRAKYGTLAALNTAWYTAFGTWEAVEPPRRDAFVPSCMDWRYFMDDVYIPRVLDWKTQALKQHDPGRRPVFSHVAPPVIGSAADWRWARAGDFFGNSNYPGWSSRHKWDDSPATELGWHEAALLELWQGLMLSADYTRCATGRDRVFWGAEFQGGPVSTHLHLGRVPDATDIRRWMLAGLAGGMHGMSFWNHRAERFWSEANGFGLLDPQGETTERIETASRIGQAIQAHAALFAQGQPPQAQVALLVNEQLWHFCQATQNNAADLLTYNLRGHYARLWRLGIAVDFVDAEEVMAGKLADYKAAMLPFPLALDPVYFTQLQAFVQQGGLLISDACPGRFDHYGFCPRSQMVSGGEELFGARHHTLRIVREPGASTRWTPPERTFGEFAPATLLEGEAGQLRTSFYLQTLSPITATPILHAGDQVAGVRNTFGTGTAVLLGTFAGFCATAYSDNGGDQLIANVLGIAGVQADRCGRLLRRRRVFGEQQAWFLINPTAEACIETLALAGFAQAHDLLGDTIVARGEHEVSVHVPAANVGCVVVRQGDRGQGTGRLAAAPSGREPVKHAETRSQW
jgi:beta-galactosidase GanA